MTQKSSRLVLTSVNQVIKLVQNNPELLTKLPKFGQISMMEASTTPKKSCNCGGRMNITTPDKNKQVTENILSSLTDTDFKEIKNVLGLNELCYYRRVDTKLDLICV